MDALFLAALRCPIDPHREATLAQDRDQLVCAECRTRFPLKNGVPVLTPEHAQLPTGCHALSQLPCLHRN